MQKEEANGIIDCVKACFGKTIFEKKLASFGVRARVNKASMRMLENESKESDLLTRGELSVLSCEKLGELKKSMEKEITALNTEMMQLLEEQHVMSSENELLKKESKDLEESVRKITHPWVNRYPHSDDLTRAFLLS